MRIVFMGTPAAAVPSLERCLRDGHEILSVWTQPDKPAGRGHRLAHSEVKEFALQQGLKIDQPQRIRSDEAKRLFASYKADVAVVVAYGKILPKEFLEAPALGCINVHFSLLPRYRGAAPVNWAIINGDKSTGVTTMFIEEHLESGPILLQHEVAIRPEETAPELMDRLAIDGAKLLSETLTRLEEIRPNRQDDSIATFAPMLKKEDGLVDWSTNAVAIERRIRGLQPWPNAHTPFRGQHFIIWNAETLQANDSMAAGQVIRADAGGLIVRCGEGTALDLLEVQPQAKRRMTARDFLNGTHITIGESFGEN